VAHKYRAARQAAQMAYPKQTELLDKKIVAACASNLNDRLRPPQPLCNFHGDVELSMRRQLYYEDDLYPEKDVTTEDGRRHILGDEMGLFGRRRG
jgi:hypothetical protein